MVADTSATESRPQPDLGRGGYVAVDRRVREEALRLGGSHAARGALTVKEDETPNPIGVDLLCADAVVLHASALPDLVQETRLPGGASMSRCLHASVSRSFWRGRGNQMVRASLGRS